MANIITCIRIVCSIALLFCPVFSPLFWALYITAGVSDMADGAAARKTGTVSEFGSKFDTAAVFVLIAVCLIKLIPLTITFIDLKFSGSFVCATATFAAIQEGHLIRTGTGCSGLRR